MAAARDDNNTRCVTTDEETTTFLEELVISLLQGPEDFPSVAADEDALKLTFSLPIGQLGKYLRFILDDKGPATEKEQYPRMILLCVTETLRHLCRQLLSRLDDDSDGEKS